jgi:hypothetical protein
MQYTEFNDKIVEVYFRSNNPNSIYYEFDDIKKGLLKIGNKIINCMKLC